MLRGSAKEEGVLREVRREVLGKGECAEREVLRRGSAEGSEVLREVKC